MTVRTQDFRQFRGATGSVDDEVGVDRSLPRPVAHAHAARSTAIDLDVDERSAGDEIDPAERAQTFAHRRFEQVAARPNGEQPTRLARLPTERTKGEKVDAEVE